MTCSKCGGRMVGDGRVKRCPSCDHTLVVRRGGAVVDTTPVPGPRVRRAKAKPTIVRSPKPDPVAYTAPTPTALREPPMPTDRCPGCGNLGRCWPGNHPSCRENWTQR